jgi:hypothetical protein
LETIVVVLSSDLGSIFAGRRIGEVGEALDLAADVGDEVEDEAGAQRDDADDGDAGAEDRGGEARDLAGLEVDGEQGDAEGAGEDPQEQRDRREEHERALVAQQVQDREEDAPAVAEGAELGDGAGGALLVRGLDLGARHAHLHGVDGELGLDLELARAGGEALDEAAREGAVAGEHVVELAAEQLLDQAGEGPVAEAVAAAVGVLVGLDAAAESWVSGGRRRRLSQVVTIRNLQKQLPPAAGVTAVSCDAPPHGRSRSRSPRLGPHN